MSVREWAELMGGLGMVSSWPVVLLNCLCVFCTLTVPWSLY